MTRRRVKYPKPINYSSNVLVGQWVEERCHYVKQCLNHVSSYSVDYSPKPYSKRGDKHLFNNKFQGEGIHPRVIRDHEGRKYLENYSSLYDLSYNHFPKCLKEPLIKKYNTTLRMFQPEMDYTINYGNLTNFNLLEMKKEKWCRDKVIRTNTTQYRDAYAPPKLEDYSFRRYSCPKPNSTKILKQNLELHNLQLRGGVHVFAPEGIDMVVVPDSPRCNPITWQRCPDCLDPIGRRCVEQKTKSMENYYKTEIPYDCIMNKNK